jgi:N-methylhydantoinase B
MFENIPTEYLESYYPVTVLEYGSLIDSGGAGYHRGGNAVHKVYRFEVDGEIAIHDDRERSQPWGILGGMPGSSSSKRLIRADGEEVSLPSKISQVPVKAGDVLIYRTAGGGGWKDPLDRPAELVKRDVRRSLVSIDKANKDYGVVLDQSTFLLNHKATEELRERMKKKRGPVTTFSFGPTPEPIGVVEKWTQASARVAGTADRSELMGSTAAAGQAIDQNIGLADQDSLAPAQTEASTSILPL